MVRDPGVAVSVTPASEWEASGPLAGRALDFARRLAASFPPGVVGPQRITIEACPPEHAGLGTGTQLALTVGRAVGRSAGLGDLAAADLAGRLGRGARSAVGVHGFDGGGLVVEAGRRPGDPLGVLVARVPLPVDWRVLLLRPTLPPSVGGAAGLSGAAERAAFAGLETDAARADALCRLALLGLVPAAVTADWQTFSAALGDFNARAGEWFVTAQGGRYAHPRIAELVAFLRSRGFPGSGQSSWGPTVFAVCPDADRAANLAAAASFHFGTSISAEVTCGLVGPGGTIEV
jgi:beta-RFAP synthase